jgi:hypothetical protein
MRIIKITHDYVMVIGHDIYVDDVCFDFLFPFISVVFDFVSTVHIVLCFATLNAAISDLSRC